MSLVLNQQSVVGLLSLFQRLLLAVCAVMFFAACTEGYPKEDVSIINPLELNQFQRLEAMNQLGQDAHPEIKWRYRDLSSCVIQMTIEGFEPGKQTYRLQMSGAAINISFNKVDQVYGVQIHPREGEILGKQPILFSKTWVDAIEMSNLARSFQVSC